MLNNSYLGDGAYVKSEQWGDVVIYTHDGYEQTNTVCLGQSEIFFLLKWLTENGYNANKEI
jgi:hypothetical protein